MTYILDSYGECITTDIRNAEQIVDDLIERGHVITTWTDEDGSKFDLLWSWDATRIGRSSMVDAGPGKLFVGVVKLGCFGFNIGRGWLAPDYVREKLGVSGELTTARLAALIMAVRTGLGDHVGGTSTRTDDLFADPAVS